MRSRLRRSTWAMGALLALGAALGGAACTGSKGQLMLVFQTDMSVPKDIDAIRILVTLEGSVIYDHSFEQLGTEGSIRLPATLGFLTPDDPTQALRIQLIASRGEDGVRMLREVVTTVPEERTATLHLPIQFLCDGSAKPKRDANGKVLHDSEGRALFENTCPNKEDTCVAGDCVDAQVDSAVLPDYVPAEVYGGGTGKGDGACFDTVKCFDAATPVALDLDAFDMDPTVCRFTSGSDINVALLTQGGGICSQTACYVPLDGESDAGFRAEGDGTIRLPSKVCEKVEAHQLLGVVTAPVGAEGCRQKRIDLPTCGPWSASGADQYEPPDGNQPTPLVVGQTGPISLAVAASGVYWAIASTFNGEETNPDGEVRSVPLGGGEPLVIAAKQPSPRDLTVDDASGLVFWTNAGVDEVTLRGGAIMAATPGFGDPIPLFIDQPTPEGIARFGDTLYWTQLLGDQVVYGATSGEGQGVVAAGNSALITPTSLGISPYRIAAAQNIVCWTYLGELSRNDGVVACKRPSDTSASPIATGQPTPRAIVLDVGNSGNATAVYWATFEGGAIVRADLIDGGASNPVVVAPEQALPSGLAIDAESLYWTNWGDGTVMRMAKGGGTPEVLASGQLRPGAIAVDDTAVYWINEGSSEEGSAAKGGAILRVAK